MDKTKKVQKARRRVKQSDNIIHIFTYTNKINNKLQSPRRDEQCVLCTASEKASSVPTVTRNPSLIVHYFTEKTFLFWEEKNFQNVEYFFVVREGLSGNYGGT